MAEHGVDDRVVGRVVAVRLPAWRNCCVNNVAESMEDKSFN